MKKLYILLAFLLACVSANAQDYYIHYNPNGNDDPKWQDYSYKMDPLLDGTYTITVNVSGTYKGWNFGIKEIKDGKQTKWFSCPNSNGSDFNIGTTMNCATSNNKDWWVSGNNETRTFVFNPTANYGNGTLKITSGEAASVTPTNLYIVGTLKDNSWNMSSAPMMTKSGTSFTIEDVEFGDDNPAQFNFISNRGSDWDEVNKGDRFGPSTSIEITKDAPQTMEVWKVGNRVGNYVASVQKWEVTNTAGKKYKITVSFANVNAPTCLIEEIVATPDPKLSVDYGNTEVSQTTYTSATVRYKFNAENFENGQKYTITYTLNNGTPVTWQQSSTSTSGAFPINDLEAGNEYNLKLKITADGTNYSAETELTFSTPDYPTMYIFADNGSGWNMLLPTKDTSNSNIFEWKGVEFNANSFVVFTSKNSTDWSTVNADRYGPEDKSNNLEVGDDQLGVALKMVKGDGSSKTYNLTKAGTYIVTIDMSNANSMTATFNLQDNVVDPNMNKPNIVKNAIDVKPGSDVKAYVISMNTNGVDNANIYYTVDGTTPTRSSTLYTGEFQVTPGRNGMTIRAINATDAKQSGAQKEELTAVATVFEFEGTDETQRLNRFRLSISEMRAYGVKSLTASLSDENGVEPTYGTTMKSIYSWAKYEDYDNFEKMAAENPELIEYTDHCKSTVTNEIFNSIDIQDNYTNKHICRNFQNAYYRLYIHSNVEIDRIDQQSMPKAKSVFTPKATSNDLPEGYQENWVSVEGTMAGNVDPYAQTRVAYSTYVRADQTTGVEDIIVDGSTDGNVSDDSDATPVYYNLQGVRVANPSHGIYIRVQGKKATKEYVK